MKYQSLTIENFRGISKLEIDDLKRVNLLVGRNNCGKTSALEAVFLLSGMSNTMLPINIQNFRGLHVANEQDILSLFNELDIDKRIFLKGNLDNKSRSLAITPLSDDTNLPEVSKKQEVLTQLQPNYIRSNISDRIIISGIKLDCYDNEDNLVHQGQINFSGGIGIGQIPKSSYKELLRCSYLNPKITMSNIIPPLENLTMQKKLDKIISVLQKIEPDVVDIRIGARGIVYIDIGKDRLFPINIMGDGMLRILGFLATIADIKNGVVLIDEIENGLHYSSLKLAWEAILEACREHNVQLIATTHSYECIEALSNAYMEIEQEGDDIRLYRLDKKGENHKAFSASAPVLKAGLEKNFEVR